MKAVLTVAGSDPSGGAGIQADLKTFQHFGVYGMAVSSLLTVQNTTGVKRVVVLDPELVREQLRAVLEDIPPDAIKTGALGNASIVEAVAAELRQSSVPLVIDPVMLSKGGSVLLDKEAIAALVKDLIPLAYLVTPNIPEALVLARFGGLHDETGETQESLLALARAIQTLGAKRVLIKGGHSGGDPIDVLADEGRVEIFRGSRIDTTSTHGTGCALSAAVSASLALGKPLAASIQEGKAFVTLALTNAVPLGKGAGPLNFF